jgi:hypothetical protein
MMRRHLWLARALPAAGLVGGLICIGGALAPAQAQAPTSRNSEPSSPPAAVTTETVDLLAASKTGDIKLVARGQGQERVHLSIRNTSKRRLNVIVPPGLVAASTAGQPGGAGGRGLQSMGLGSIGNREGAFGDFRAAFGQPGLQSIAAVDESRSREVAVPIGQTIELTLPAVCLNYGLPTPTPHDTFTLVDVDDYTRDPRVRRALRSLSTYGTSLGVAQAVMWRVCNNLPFETMIEQGGKLMNAQEVMLAARFVETLDTSDPGELLGADALTQDRIFVQLTGEGSLAAHARRLSGQLDGMRLLGLPIRLSESEELPSCAGPALFLKVNLGEARPGETRGRVIVSSCTGLDSWVPLGRVAFRDNSSISVLDGETLAKALDRAIASAFVTVKPAHRTVGTTTLKVENRLPFTVTGVVVRAGNSAGSPTVSFQAVGVGPSRSGLIPLQAATASLVEHVELNGL